MHVTPGLANASGLSARRQRLPPWSDAQADIDENSGDHNSESADSFWPLVLIREHAFLQRGGERNTQPGSREESELRDKELPAG